MKKKMITAGFLAASIVMVMFVSIAAGAPVISTIAISGPGVVWQFNPPEGEVTDVLAYYYLTSDTENAIIMAEPIHTSISDNLVTLIFSISDTADLAGNVDSTGVNVTVNGVVTTIAGGPGFAWGRTR
jgi:hypothetical protein